MFDFIKGQEVFEIASFKSALKELDQSKSKYQFLGFVAQTANDADLTSFMISRIVEEVFTDKNPNVLEASLAFETFYGQLDEDSLKTEIIP